MADYIKREALEAELNRRLKFLVEENTEYDHYTSGYDEAVDTVENFPSAADVVDVVHGKWVFKSAGPYKQTRSYCSACGRHSGIGGIQKNQEKPFCPNCGAKMDGGVENGK